MQRYARHTRSTVGQIGPSPSSWKGPGSQRGSHSSQSNGCVVAGELRRRSLLGTPAGLRARRTEIRAADGWCALIHPSRAPCFSVVRSDQRRDLCTAIKPYELCLFDMKCTGDDVAARNKVVVDAGTTTVSIFGHPCIAGTPRTVAELSAEKCNTTLRIVGRMRKSSRVVR